MLQSGDAMWIETGQIVKWQLKWLELSTSSVGTLRYIFGTQS